MKKLYIASTLSDDFSRLTAHVTFDKRDIDTAGNTNVSVYTVDGSKQSIQDAVIDRFKVITGVASIVAGYVVRDGSYKGGI